MVAADLVLLEGLAGHEPERGIEPHYFHAKKGDVLIWHANLIHGGSMRRNLQLSRRALVCHFFVKGSFAYHDLSASETKPYSGTCLLRPADEAVAGAKLRGLFGKLFRS